MIAILKEAEAGPTVGEVIRRHGIAAKTYYRWMAKYAGWRSATPSVCGRSRTRTGD